jgi:hypothetical protein
MTARDEAHGPLAWRGAVVGLLALGACAPGCTEEWGASPRGDAMATGRVHVGDAPVTGGWVEFLPTDGARGSLRSAPIGPDGTFRATRVARGRNVIRIVGAPAAPPFDRAFTQFYSPIRPTIGEGSALDIDLARARGTGLGGGQPR